MQILTMNLWDERGDWPTLRTVVRRGLAELDAGVLAVQETVVSAELSTRSDDVHRRWGAHDVRTHGAGVTRFHHVVGDRARTSESLDLRAEPDLTMPIHAAEPGSPSDDALHLLASAAAAPDAVTRTRRR